MGVLIRTGLDKVLALPADALRVGSRTALSAAAPSGLLTSLTSYWKLEEASGTRVDAVVASGNDLTDNNTVTQAAGIQGNASDFATANLEYLSHADNASLRMGDIDFTIAAWIRPTVASDMIIVGKDTDSPANARDYTLDYFGSGGKARFYLNGGATAITFDTYPVATSVWAFVVGWHDSVANTVNIQINNATPVSVGTGGLVPQTSVAEFRIGARQYSGFEGYWNGQIDEVGIWKRTLTTTERTNLYNAGVGVTYPFTGVP